MQKETGGRVTRVEATHLTLAFLGDVGEEDLPLLRDFKPEGERHPFPINQARYWKHNQIVWVGPEEIPGELREIVSSLGSFLGKNGFRTEERGFAAHITLIRKARPPRALPELPKILWPVDEVMLVRSHLSSKGSSYEALQRYPLT